MAFEIHWSGHVVASYFLARSFSFVTSLVPRATLEILGRQSGRSLMRLAGTPAYSPFASVDFVTTAPRQRRIPARW
jgi:hypothetical protein